MKIKKAEVLNFSKFLALFLTFVLGTTAIEAQTTLEKRKAKVTPLPAISFSPETGLTYGIIGDYDFDLAEGNEKVSMSKLRGSLVGTTKNQIISEWTYRLFFPEDKFRIFGRFSYKKFPDRDYRRASFGMTPNMLFGGTDDMPFLNYSTDRDDELQIDSLYFINFAPQRLFLESSFLWNVKEHLYLGPTIDAEYLFNFKLVGDSVGIPTNAPNDAVIYSSENSYPQENNARFGIGFHGIYDTRDDKRNAYDGLFLQLMGLTYTKLFGADDVFNRLFFDGRFFKSLNESKTTIFGAQLIQDFRFSDSPLDKMNYFSFSRLGGRDMLRGYFQGTYLDQHTTSLQAEIRQKLFSNYTGQFSKLLNRVGVVAYLATGQAYGINEFDFSNFKVGAGAGLRISINNKERTNIRIDYAFGFDKDSKFGEGGQRGLYFFLGESF